MIDFTSCEVNKFRAYGGANGNKINILYERKNTSGVDKELWSTPASKMTAVLSLTDKNYKAKPLRRVFIEKKGKKAKRPLGIPCIEGYMKKTGYLKREFEDDLVRRLLQTVRVINESKVEIQFKSGIVMSQRIDFED